MSRKIDEFFDIFRCEQNELRKDSNEKYTWYMWEEDKELPSKEMSGDSNILNLFNEEKAAYKNKLMLSR